MQPPKEIQNLLTEVFYHGSAYGQLATTSIQNIPSVRTVHLLGDQNVEKIYVNCHILSEKWADIANGRPHVAGCYWDKEKRIQFRFNAQASLLSHKNQTTDPFLQEMWEKMRPTVRTAYLLAQANIPMYQEDIDIDLHQHADDHGVIICEPFQWDIFREDTKEYRFGKRSLYKLAPDNTWGKKDISSLHEKDILLYDKKSKTVERES